ncbi:MAG: protein translocase subunit SecF, partial [Bacteroidota bacterium]
RLFEYADYNIVGNLKIGYIISGILLTISVLSLLTRGIETGIDFQGGTEFVIETSEALSVTDARATLGEALGTAPEVKEYGSANELLIRSTVGGDISELSARVTGALEAANPGVTLSVEKTDSFAPRFADDLKRGALYAVLGSLFVIFVYILMRFGELFPFRLQNFAFPLGAVAALAHDVTITLGLFSLLQGVVPFSLQIDQAIIAAFLTIVGYSLNDTVIIFDRIREYTNIFKTESVASVVNRSINQTLSRTVVTSLTTFIVVAVLFVAGGPVLRGFAFALIIGVVIGTYSSVFVASPVVVALKSRGEE